MITKFFAELTAVIALKLLDRARKSPKHIQGKGPGKLEKRLREQLKKQLPVVLICVCVLFAACTPNKIIYVPHGKAVRLGQDVKNVDGWAQDQNGEWVYGEIDLIPNGYYCLPLQDEDDE
jgi:hypothetical protein